MSWIVHALLPPDRIAPSRTKSKSSTDVATMQRASSPPTVTTMMTRATGCRRRGCRCSSLHRGAVERASRAGERDDSRDTVIRLPATLLTSSATNDYTSARNLRNHGPAWVSPRQDALAHAARPSITTKPLRQRRTLPAILKYAAGSRAATTPATFTFLPLICNKERNSLVHSARPI